MNLKSKEKKGISQSNKKITNQKGPLQINFLQISIQIETVLIQKEKLKPIPNQN